MANPWGDKRLSGRLLEGSNVVITGAGSPNGIGRATARLFALHGARLATLDISESGANETAALIGPEHLAMRCDVSLEDSCRVCINHIIDKFGRIDILVNNAAIAKGTRMADVTPAEYDAVHDLNLRGTPREIYWRIDVTPEVGTPHSATRSALFWQTVDRTLFVIVDMVAATLVGTEVLVLAVGVFARYVLKQPLIWTDEVALMLFMWLAMLGTAVAAHRNEHMRLSFLINQLPVLWRRRIDGFMLLTMVALLLTIFPSSILYTKLQTSEITPALELPASYRVLSISIAIGIFTYVICRRIFTQYSLRELAPLAAAALSFAALLWLSKSLFVSMGDYSLIVFFVVLVLTFVLLGMPIAMTFGTVTVAFLLLLTNAPLTIVMNRLDGGISDLILLSIPLFILLGYLIEATGLAKALIDLMVNLLGHVKGGLCYVLLCGMYLVSGISGSKAADMAAISPILLPEMRRRGVKDGEIISLLSPNSPSREHLYS